MFIDTCLSILWGGLEVFLRTEPFKCTSSVFPLFLFPQPLFIFCSSLSSLAPKYVWPWFFQAQKFKNLYKSLFDIIKLPTVRSSTVSLCCWHWGSQLEPMEKLIETFMVWNQHILFSYNQCTYSKLMLYLQRWTVHIEKLYCLYIYVILALQPILLFIPSPSDVA